MTLINDDSSGRSRLGPCNIMVRYNFHHILQMDRTIFLPQSYFMFGELNQKEIEDLLHQQVIGRIGCYANNTTYVVPISYAYDGEYIYAHTQEGMKIRMMRQNRSICFEVDSLHDLANWQSVICWGEFEELKNEPERNLAIQKLHDRILPLVSSVTTKLSPEWPFTPTETSVIPGVIFRIRLAKKTGRFENSTVPSFLAWG
jgi:uncharacterized protein